MCAACATFAEACEGRKTCGDLRYWGEVAATLGLLLGFLRLRLIQASKDLKNGQFCPVVRDLGALLLQVASFHPTASSEGDKAGVLRSYSLGQYRKAKICYFSTYPTAA
ncbi:hypothetical protein GOBAR_DD35260 [Gossypium barbadense]|nr:hypothetical protein GOBAR_DD35260 [Gossypium barbadense]